MTNKERIMRTQLPYKVAYDGAELTLTNRDYQVIDSKPLKLANGFKVEGFLYNDGCKPWDCASSKARCEDALAAFNRGDLTTLVQMMLL